MSEHTKLPWHASRKAIFISDTNNRIIAEMDRRGKYAADAALIVKAVNNHDSLVSALTLFLATDDAMEGILWGSEPDTALVKISIPLGQYREARKALRRVGEASTVIPDQADASEVAR